MKPSLLIDTNILRRLVSKTEFSYNLRHLEFWVKNQYVSLLVPEILKKEWLKHREEERKRIEKSLENEKSEARTRRIFQDYSAEFMEQRIDEHRQLLNSQISCLDELIEKFSITIQPSAELLLLINNQRTLCKKPFLDTPKDNMNDALVIFCGLDYVSTIDSNEIYFVTDNYKEFAVSATDLRLHGDIAQKYPEIQCHYFDDFKHLFPVFTALNIPLPENKQKSQSGNVETYVPVDTTQPLLNQIESYLQARFENLNFIPKHLFAEHYPFILGDRFTYQRKVEVLTTNNKPLYDLMTAVKVEKGIVKDDSGNYIKSDNDEERIKKIFRCLYQNHIYRIAFEDNKEVEIVYSGNETVECSCSLCLYNRLDFESLLRGNQDELFGDEFEQVSQQMRSAYGHYKVGNYKKSQEAFECILIERKEKKDLIYYLLQFNLYHLAPLIRNYYWKEADTKELVNRLFNINLDKVYKDCSTSYKDQPLLDYVHKREFIKVTGEKMQVKVNATIDQFYGQNTGFNQDTIRLMELFNSAESFLDKNGIVYDVFSEFEEVRQLYVQGLLASYGLNPLMSGKLLHVDDFILKKFLFNAKADVMQKYLNRFKIKDIKYVPTEKEAATFVNLFIRFLEEYDKTVIAYTETVQETYHHFWDTYSRIITNGLTIIGVIQLSPEVTNTIAEKLLPVVASNKHLHYFELLKSVRFFFNRKQKDISADILGKYFVSSLLHEEYHHENYFETVATLLAARKVCIPLNDEEFENARRLLFIPPDKPSRVDSWFSIGYLFQTLDNETQKEEIRQFAVNSLNAQFESGRFYLATMFGIIADPSPFHKQYEESISKLIEEGQQPRPLWDRDYYFDSRIDNYLNYCWRFNLELIPSLQKGNDKLGDYYRWLLDMNNFDYVNFDTKWLYNHFTVYFKLNFRKCTPLKEYLLQMIKADTNTKIERMFILIYVMND